MTNPRRTDPKGPPSHARTVLVIGANRGIGLELCRQLAGRGDHVIATCRKHDGELEGISGVEVHTGVDVTDETSISSLREALGEHRVDDLWIVAGILKPVSLETLDAQPIREQFEVNALGPLMTTAGLLPCLRRGSKIALLTSRMGSIADNTSGGSYGYRMSKAALNMAGRSLALDLAPREIAVAILHPGWVKTDMTAGQGLIDPATSATGLIRIVDELTLGRTGRFIHQSGEALPW